nr:hypothetical protein [Tanacetum cinerariifolium]
MQQFWNTIKKIKDTDAYLFKLDKKKCQIDTEVFREILQICPKLPNQECIFGKSTGLDRLRESRAQILWGMFYQKNVDYVALLWEDFMCQADKRDISLARKEHMPYPRFIKVIICYQKYEALILEETIDQDIKDSKAYKTYLAFTTRQATPKKARKFKKVSSPLKKLSLVLEEELAKKPKRAKKPVPAKQTKTFRKSTTMPTCVVIRDTLGVSVSKNKASYKVDRGKVIDLLFDVALFEVPDKQEDKTTGTDEGIGSKPGVLDVLKYQSKSENESWGDSDDDNSNDDDEDDLSNDDDDVDSDADGDNEACDGEKTDSDKDENLNLNLTDDEEEYDEELKDPDHEKEGKEMTDTGHDDAIQQKAYEQVVDDARVTLPADHVTQKTEGPYPSSSVSSDFTSQFLNLDNTPPTESKVVSMKNVKVSHEEPSTQTPPLLTIPLTTFKSYSTEFEKKAEVERKIYIDLIEQPVKDIIKDEVKSQLSEIIPKEVSDFATLVIQRTISKSLENVVLDKYSSQSTSTYEAAAELYDGLFKSYKLEKDLFESYGKAYSLKRDRDDKDKDKDPPAGLDQGLKERKTSKDVEPPKGSKSKESKSSSSNDTKSQQQSSGKYEKGKEPVFETKDTEMPQNQGSDLGNTDDQPNVKAALKRDWFKKLKRPLTPDRF